MSDPRLTPETPIPTNLAYGGGAGLIVRVRIALALLMKTLGRPGLLLLARAIPSIWRNDFLKLFRPLEAALRRLVVFEALTLSRSLPEQAATPPCQPRVGRSARSAGERQFDPFNSASWRIAFAVLPPARKPKPETDAELLISFSRLIGLPVAPAPPRPELRTHHASRRLAFRLEAALRVALDPAPFIQRLARRIHRASRTQIASLATFNRTPSEDMTVELWSLALMIHAHFLRPDTS